MLPSQHTFSHQHYPGPNDWQHHSHIPQHGGQSQNIALSHYRNQGLEHHSNERGIGAGGAQQGGQDGAGMNEDNRRVLEWIAQMMRVETRESALLELSKKREQVPELALILWHSFGESAGSHGSEKALLTSV